MLKFKRKLADWKKDSLNQAGRLSLINSTINNLPTYWFSLHKVPVGINHKLEAIRRDFFWGSPAEKEGSNRKMCMVAWNQVCRPKKSGGLGLISFKDKNASLLCKWFHKWQFDKHKKWNVWIRSKYSCTKSTTLLDLGQNTKGNKASSFLGDILQISQNLVLGPQMQNKNFC